MPYFYFTVSGVGSFTSPSMQSRVEGGETGPPYPRRCGSLTICCCNCKGSTFSHYCIGLAGIRTHNLQHSWLMLHHWAISYPIKVRLIHVNVDRRDLLHRAGLTILCNNNIVHIVLEWIVIIFYGLLCGWSCIFDSSQVFWEEHSQF